MSGFAAWNEYTAYAVGDAVSYAGLDYVATVANINAIPGLTIVWNLITPGGGGGLTNPLTTDLDLGANDIINTNDTQTTSIGVDVIDLRAGSLAPRITVSQGMDFTSITSTTFTTVPQTNAAPTVGDDLCNKTYVDSVAGGGTPLPTVSYYYTGSGQYPGAGGGPVSFDTLDTANSTGTVAGSWSGDTWTNNTTDTITYSVNGSVYYSVVSFSTVELVGVWKEPTAEWICVGGYAPQSFAIIPSANVVLAPGESFYIKATTNAPSAIAAGGSDHPTRINITQLSNVQGPPGPPGPPGGITNPLTADILANGFSLQNAATVQTNTLSVSSDPFINVSSPIQFTDPTLPAQFTLPPQTSVAPTVGNDLTNKTYVDGLTPNLAGLFNYLRIVPTAAGQTISTVYYTGGSGVGYPSSWIPDTTPNTPILPTAGTSNEWALNKPASPSSGSRWWAWPYNNYAAPYSPTSVPVAPSVPIIKKNLNALYAIIRVKSSVNITIQGAIFFNIYSYDYAGSPSQAFSIRHDYQANNLALPNTTGALNLQSGFTYLVYACDAEKTVASPAVPAPGGTSAIALCNGQTPSQLTSQMLRDPYDIHTDLNHIPLPAVAYALGATPPPGDINSLPISGIAFGCPSNAITNGANIELIAVGYRANGGAINQEYSLQYT